MDLLPDDSADIKKAKSVMRWDAKRKKYLPTMVTADGRALKGQRRNESGKKVKGEAQKSHLTILGVHVNDSNRLQMLLFPYLYIYIYL